MVSFLGLFLDCLIFQNYICMYSKSLGVYVLLIYVLSPTIYIVGILGVFEMYLHSEYQCLEDSVF